MALEQAVSQLVAIRTNDMKVIQQGFALNDAHVVVLQMVANDIAKGSARLWPPHPDVIEGYYKPLLESDDPLVLWEDHADNHHLATPRCGGQILWLEWYHERYNQLMKVLQLAAWMKEIVDGSDS